MKMRRFDNFTYIFLVNASQMAYIEDARQTHAVLQKFNELYRYLMRDDNTAMLGDELKALQNYLDIQAVWHGTRFRIVMYDAPDRSDIYMKHLYILDFIDNIMSDALSRYENFFSISLDLKIDTQVHMHVLLEADNNKETFSITLPEEVK